MLRTTSVALRLLQRNFSSRRPMESRICKQLTEQFKPVRLRVLNESRKHHRDAGAETHFKITIVSSSFENCSQVQRHRLIANALSEEFQSGLVALSITARSPSEPLDDHASPPCLNNP
ncbi:hypothetical protein CRM22_007255 [Opisthorchis felineus]|uniref:Uncharacterized protein n=1 Tax=Opisthorchis felineus TaxID=147828 RepID=A0A4S2LGQ7_OPIFE|nr:hypothetical protein CRM22_007255 [Opisthorchis felineus]TGZ62762.1 hypothetical protein CRM22_007255 [Opisthorchis felineus]